MASVGVRKSDRMGSQSSSVKKSTSIESRTHSTLSTEWRKDLHLPQNLGQKLADAIANGMGSWSFIIAQSVIVIAWILFNIVGFIYRWDPYPFILLNLLFSTQAAYAAPVIMMSQNRQAQKDHIRDDHEAEEVDLLYKINRQQLEILTLLRANLCPEDAEKIAKELSASTGMTTGATRVAPNGKQAGQSQAQTPKVSVAPTRRKR